MSHLRNPDRARRPVIARHRPNLAAKGLGDELGPKADADNWDVLLVCRGEQLHLALHPRKIIADVHRAAERNDALDIVEVGGDVRVGARFGEIEPAEIDPSRVVAQRESQATGVLVRGVLEDQDGHRAGW